jgi:cytochrome b6-f complex iron-sulfur subunit
MTKSRKRSSRKQDRKSQETPKGLKETDSNVADATGLADSRRSFLGRLWLGLAGVALVEIVWIVLNFLRPRASVTPSDSNVLVAGPIDRFEPSTVTAFQEGRLYLSRLQDGGFLALSRECTHLGCTVPWVDGENRFVCPCHSSAYDDKGAVLSPPAPRPLDFYPVRIENGIVKVDLSKPTRRRSFEYTQVTRP